MAKAERDEGRRITLRVSEDLYRAIADAADEREWSVSHWIAYAIEQTLGPTARAIPRKVRRAPRSR